MSSYSNSLFIPIETHSYQDVTSIEKNESYSQTFFKKLDVSPHSVTDILRQTPTSSTPTIVSSSVFPRSASEALFDSSSKFRQLPCRTFISVGTCPYRERCVYLHDPRCICREAKTKTRRKNKEDVVVDALFWPVMPYSLVAGKLDANRQPHVIQSYSVPIPQQDTYRSHDQAVYSTWMHFVDFCLANSESQCGTDNAPCFQAPDQRVNAYTDKERLSVFLCLSMPGRKLSAVDQVSTSSTCYNERNGSCAQSVESTYSKPQHFTAPNDIRNLQYPVLNQPASNGGGSGYGQPTTGAQHNSLLNLYAESNPHAFNGRNSAMVPSQQPPTVHLRVHSPEHCAPMMHYPAHYPAHQQRQEQHYGSRSSSYQCLSPDAEYNRMDRQRYSTPSPISIAEKSSPATASSGYTKRSFPMLNGVRDLNPMVSASASTRSGSLLEDKHFSLEEVHYDMHTEAYDYFPNEWDPYAEGGYRGQQQQQTQSLSMHNKNGESSRYMQQQPRLSPAATVFRYDGQGGGGYSTQVFA